LGADVLEHADHVLAAEARLGHERQTLARVAVDQRQHPDASPVGHGVAHEVHRPDFVRLRRDETRAAWHGTPPAAGPLTTQL